MRNGFPTQIPGSIGRRRTRAARPGCEALEGRALLAVSALDPNFGRRGVALGELTPQGPLAFITVRSDSAVQRDGKVVTVTQYDATDPAVADGLTVERRNADGTADPSFGGGGAAILMFPAGFDAPNATPGIALAPDGSVVLAIDMDRSDATGAGNTNDQRSLVARLTPGGQLDAGFGQGGKFLVDLPAASFSRVDVQPDGKVVAAGITGTYGSRDPFANDLQVTAIRLTAAGAYDTSFHGTGRVDVLPAALSTRAYEYVSALALAPDGQILIASELQDPIVIDYGPPSPHSPATVLSRVGADGTPDPTFGTAGSLDLSARVMNVFGLVVQADGKVVLGGLVAAPTPFTIGTNGLIRLLDDGRVDPSFVTARLDAPVTHAPDALSALALGPDGGFTLVGSAYVPGVSPAVGPSTFSRGHTQLVVQRFRGDGTPDAAFGAGGRFTFFVAPSATPGSGDAQAYSTLTGVAVTRAGQVVATGRLAINRYDSMGQYAGPVGDQLVLARLNPTSTRSTAGDYDGDNKADVAAQLAVLGIFAIRPSSGGPDRLDGFGPRGIAEALPLTGDFDGDGRADVAAYLTASGTLAYRPSGGGPDVLRQFGSAGYNQSIPVAGDFDGDGRTDVAVYLPASARFAISPSGGGPNYYVPLGVTVPRASVPAVLDYDGDGKADPAVYLPVEAQLTYRSSASGAAVVEGFGVPGFGETLPAAASYDLLPAIPGPPPIPIVPARSLDIALTDDVLATLAGTTTGKKKA